MSHSGPQKTIAIIGAGLAGLSCATKLQAQGSLVNVIIGEEITIQQLAGVLSRSEQASSKRRVTLLLT
jgi:2-polyprenyl-6-methoxyphenol hydroxylase-like FAD-dependent oxidoreductase